MISGGGTGGHVYPALAVAEALKSQVASCEFLYVGGKGGAEEKLVVREELPFVSISAGGLRDLAPWKTAVNLCRMTAGFVQSLRLVGDFAPDVVMVTGGYVCVPLTLAAKLSGVPVLVFLPDLEPGLAVRALTRLATRIAVSFPESARYFAKNKVVVTGYPVRADFLSADKVTARQRFGLEGDLKVVTVFGGSHGARSINLALGEILDRLLESCQVIHICGHLDAEWVMRHCDKLPERLRGRYRVHPYLHEEMASALAAANLVVARAGAATLGEFPALGLPSILVPYPYAGQHQELNADYLVSQGAAVKIADAELGEKLLLTVLSLLTDSEALVRMGKRARALARPKAAESIAKEIRQLGKGNETSK